MKKTALHFLPVDYITLAYAGITAVYMLLGLNTLTNVGTHLLVRVVIAALVTGFAAFDSGKINHYPIYNFIRNFYPLLLLGYFYKETGYLNNIIFDYFDQWFVQAEQFLWGMQPSIEFSIYFPQKWFSELMNFSYFLYYLTTIGLALTALVYNKSKLKEIIFIIFTSFIIYYLFFDLFPVKGPQFYFSGQDAQPVNSYLYSKMVKVAQNIGEAETGAFPSSHVGMSIIFLILSFKHLRKIFWIILLPMIILWFATVYIKAHYLIDVIGGFISAPLVYFVAVKLYKRLTLE